jgi:hypothetical protein
MIDRADFIAKDYGWEQPNSYKFFWDKQVVIVVTTKTDSDYPDKEIFNEQIETLDIIFTAWKELSDVIEKEIITYEEKTKEQLLKVADSPKIWLNMDYDTNKPLSNNRWSFVLRVAQNDDFGWHVEFEGRTHLETWAGG